MSSDPEALLSPLVDAARSGTVSEYLRDLAAPGSALASALFEADPRRSGVVCDSVVDVLNDTEAGSKVKVRALVALAELARDPRGRDVVMRAVRRMDDVFEKSFVEKEDVRHSAPSVSGARSPANVLRDMDVHGQRPPAHPRTTRAPCCGSPSKMRKRAPFPAPPQSGPLVRPSLLSHRPASSCLSPTHAPHDAVSYSSRTCVRFAALFASLHTAPPSYPLPPSNAPNTLWLYSFVALPVVGAARTPHPYTLHTHFRPSLSSHGG